MHTTWKNILSYYRVPPSALKNVQKNLIRKKEKAFVEVSGKRILGEDENS